MAPMTEPLVYEIRLKGHLGSQWADWFSGLSLTLEDNGETVLTGPLADQSALHGVLKKVRDLGMPLLAVNRIERHASDGVNVRFEPDASITITKGELV